CLLSAVVRYCVPFVPSYLLVPLSHVLVSLLSHGSLDHRVLRSFPTRRSSDLDLADGRRRFVFLYRFAKRREQSGMVAGLLAPFRSEEHTSEFQSRRDLVCRLLLEKKKKREKTAQRDTRGEVREVRLIVTLSST